MSYFTDRAFTTIARPHRHFCKLYHQSYVEFDWTHFFFSNNEFEKSNKAQFYKLQRIMSAYNNLLAEIQEANAKLKMILDEVSKMRVKCAQMQLDILSLYKPECLEILEMLKSVNNEQCLFNETPFEENTRTSSNNKS